MDNFLTKMERGGCSLAQGKSMKDQFVLRALWNEIYLRNQTRIAQALKKGGKDRETLEKEFPTIPLEQILKKIEQEAV